MTIYADENKNLIFFSWIENPACDPEAEMQKTLDWIARKQQGNMEGVRGRRSVSPPDLIPPVFTVRDPIVLEYPSYTVEDVVSAWHQTEENAGKGKPYTRNKRECFKDPMIFYTGKKKIS